MSRLSAFSLAVLRRTLWLIAVGLMLVALYVSLGRQLVPLVAEYRLEVQDKAHELLAMPLSIGRLEGRWRGFAPRLLAHDVLLGEGGAAMRLDRLALEPDLAASLWSRQLHFKSVEVSGIHLSLVQDKEGRWRVEGFPEREQQSSNPLERLAEVQRLGRLSLLDSQVTVEAHGEAPLSLTYANLELRSLDQRLQLSGGLILPDGQPLSLNVQARINHDDWRDSAARLYLQLPRSDWAQWLPEKLITSWKLERLQAGGELWLDWRERSLAKGVAHLVAPALELGQSQSEPVLIEELALKAYLDRASEGYRLQVDGLAFSFDGARWDDMALVLQQHVADDHWQLGIDQLPVAPLAKLAQALVPMPAVASEYLLGLAPSGTLRNVQLDYRAAAPLAERLAFVANLDKAAIDAYHWIPAASNVSGLARGNLGGGELHFDSQDFSLHLAQLFPRPWDYQRSRGSLAWTLNEEAFTLVAPYLQVEGEEGKLAGDFLIRLMRDPEAEDYMDLRVGLSEGDARYTEKYLPTRSPALSPALSEWLTAAIREGIVEQGYFQYQGSLNKSAVDTARSLSLYFKVRDADFAFQPGWPALREGRGEVLIEDDQVRVRLAEGRMLDSRVHHVLARIPLRQGERPLRLAIEGQVEAGLRDALTLMQVAPIGTADLFAGWRGEGALSGSLKLDIPLAAGKAPKVEVEFSSADASLYIPQADLQLGALSGDFRYDSERGLSASRISASALGSPISGKASATGTPGKPATRIEAGGVVSVAQLKAWRKIEQSLPASGQIPFQLSLALGGTESRLQIDSSLLGTRLQLPEPFAKAANQRRDTTLRMTLGGERQQYTVKHGSLAALTFTAPGNRWSDGGGELVLGGAAANLRSDRGLHVRGHLPRANLADWQALLAEYSAPDQGQQATSLLRRAQLDIGVFEGFGTRVENLALDLRRQADAWSLGLDSQIVAGNVRLPDAQGQPMVLKLSHLRLPASEPAEPEVPRQDPLAAVDPRNLPAMDIAVAKVLQGEQLLGAWSLKIRPRSDGVEFSDLDLDLKGLRLAGAGGWNTSRSWYKGRLEGGNLADVLLAWGFAPSTTSVRFHVDADASWPGSPAFFGMQRLSGRLDARVRNGQLREVDGSAQALRVFGLLNFDSIGRRLRLDFSDLFSKGLSFDRIKGELVATEGIFVTQGPITVTGPSSNLELDGRLDMVHDRIDAKLLVTLPVSNNLPLAALIVGAPAIGGALFVVDKLLGDKVARFASVQYKVEGPWQSPKITFDKPFEKPN
ncbi:YhdP family protein [Pseudomonas saudiphocaensis]|uniref:YhdP family protein n=1 Tax=Pseudomonas saudiphocaensis TaxID=1499686 RepID=UPI000F78E906|nr:YhdP family protein [Pseudomonas saudiphocaensis]RRV15416.1 TIGR02099 family protein [Pseudomonas saudiphocaensis]